MDITFDCLHCGQSLEVDESGAGMNVPCPKCGRELTVPSATVRDAPPSPPVVTDAPRKTPRIVKCPYCMEDIREGAIKCKHCGSNLAGYAPQITARTPPVPVAEARTRGGSTYNSREVLTLARTQKTFCWVILAYLLALLGLLLVCVLVPESSAAVRSGMELVGWAATILTFIFSYPIAAALKLRVPWLYAAGAIACAPLVLLVLGLKANKALRSMGIRVGLMGASSADLRKLVQTAG